mmetsp:Transcript_30898/g.74580  ORF Transcript_30898/g.74580 Transcript_30898/m.74580 type:complete len:110 (+) Transcript_30898:337-666(+)
MLKEIEQAYDSKRVCFLCNPFEITITFTVLDKSLLSGAVYPAGCKTSFADLDKRQIGPPSIGFDKRPSFQILSQHAKCAVQNAFDRGWITAEQKASHESWIQVASPDKT